MRKYYRFFHQLLVYYEKIFETSTNFPIFHLKLSTITNYQLLKQQILYQRIL